jgi:hypothetical protein
MPYSPPVEAKPVATTCEPSAQVEGTIVLRTETTTVVADADGVIVEEIEHGRAETPVVVEPPLVEPPASTTPIERTDASSLEAPEGIPSLAASLPEVASPTERRNEARSAPTSASRSASPARGDLLVHLGDRHWRVRGLEKNTSPELMKVNVMVSREGAGFHVDALDLYSARQRAAYTTMASAEVGVEERVLKKDLGELLLKLEELRDKSVQNAEDHAAKKRKL